MSFSKARLRRFNEEIPQVPSPGRYDPKLDAKVKGAIMPISKRFPNQTCTSSSLDNLERAATASSQVIFRTPQVMKKVPLTPRVHYLHDKNFDTSSSSILSSEEKSISMTSSKKVVTRADYKRLEQELSALADEHLLTLTERDIEIKQLKETIEEITTRETELKQILEEKTKLASERHKEALDLKINLDTMVDKIKIDREEHQQYIDELKSEVLSLQNKKYELEMVLAEKQSAIVTINDKYLELENELKSLEEEKALLEQENHKILNVVEEKFDKLQEDLKDKVNTLAEEYDGEFQKAQVDFQSKINFMYHEFNSHQKEIDGILKYSQERVKELEKMFDKKVKEFSKDIKEADESCKYIYRELRKVEAQRDELLESDLEKKLTIIDIKEKSDLYKNELEYCRISCKKYQITLNTMQETITALSDRLFESEGEVERLNAVEVDLESQKKLLEEKTQSLLSDISALREGMDKMEEEIIRDVTALKEYLEAKADNFRAEATNQVEHLNKNIYEKQCAIEVLLGENDFFKKELERKDIYIKELKDKENVYQENIAQLKTDCLNIEEELTEKLSAQKNLCKVLNDELEKAKSLVDQLHNLKRKHESQIYMLEEKVEEYKSAVLTSQKEVLSLENENSRQTSSILALQCEIESCQKIIQKGKEEETKQRQYIDELVSDLVLEKERCVALETDKDRIKTLLFDAEVNTVEKSEEVSRLTSQLELLERSLKNAEDKISLIEDERAILEQQIILTENNAAELKNTNAKEKLELENTISELQTQLSFAKEKIKVEIPKLERDNINKVENILELNLNVDSLKEDLNDLKTKILCLEAEKDSLNNVLEESKNKLSTLETMLHDKNLIINDLNEEKNRVDALYKDMSSQFDALSTAYNTQNEQLKQNTETAIKLMEDEEKILDLEQQVLNKDKEIELLQQRILDQDETASLKEELEELRQKYQLVVEDREKLNQDLADLMGHQNIRQRIKHVNRLKQDKVELKNEVEFLRFENAKLKKKLCEKESNKENVNLSCVESGQKISKQNSTKKPLSPAVLKPSNHQH